MKDAAKNDYKMSSFINGVIKSAAFQRGRATEAKAVETTVAAGNVGRHGGPGFSAGTPIGFDLAGLKPGPPLVTTVEIGGPGFSPAIGII